MVFDAVVCPTLKFPSDLSPSVAEFIVHTEKFLFLFIGPFFRLDAWIELIMPSTHRLPFTFLYIVFLICQKC